MSLAAAIATMVGVSAIVAVSAQAVIVIAKRAADGRLGPNRWAGIRTRTTLASPEAWRAAHQAGYPRMRMGGIAGHVTAALALIVGAAVATTADPDVAMGVWGAILVVGSLAMAGFAIAATVRGQAAAKGATEPG